MSFNELVKMYKIRKLKFEGKINFLLKKIIREFFRSINQNFSLYFPLIIYIMFFKYVLKKKSRFKYRLNIVW